MSDKNTRSFSELVFQRGKLKVLRELLDNPSRRYNISELSRESEASYDVTYRFSQDLIDLGVLRSQKVGKSRILELNEESPYVEKLRELVSIDSEPLKEVAEEYASEIKEQLDTESIILFGSVAKGTSHIDSDVDILVLVDGEVGESEDRANRIASKYEREQGITITPLLKDYESFIESLELEEPFAMEVRKYGEVLGGKKPW